MSTNTTKIDVLLKNPNGWPLTNVCFGVKPVRTGFLDNDVSIVEDRELVYKTDDKGYAQMELLPLPFPYVLTYSEDTEEIPGYFVFYVPENTAVLQFKDLVVSTLPTPPSDYGEEILKQIVAARAQVTVLAQQAQQSATNAGAFADASEKSATKSEQAANSMAGARDQVLSTQNALQAVLYSIDEAIVKIQAINLQNKLVLGGYQIFVDPTGLLRIKNGTPANPTDGIIVGEQHS